jgi:hypothetical protein
VEHGEAAAATDRWRRFVRFVLFRSPGEEMTDFEKRERGRTFICKMTLISAGTT